MNIQQARELRKNQNIRAFLDMIGEAEGANYQTLVNKGTQNKVIKDLSRHPNLKIGGKYPSTAAGKYQFLFSTWEDFRQQLGLKDFSPESQDLAAIAQLSAKGAIQPILDGKIEVAIKKTNRVWASFPGSPYGQGGKTLNQMLGWYQSARGKVSEVVSEVVSDIAQNPVVSGGLTIGAVLVVLGVFF